MDRLVLELVAQNVSLPASTAAMARRACKAINKLIPSPPALRVSEVTDAMEVAGGAGGGGGDAFSVLMDEACESGYRAPVRALRVAARRGCVRACERILDRHGASIFRGGAGGAAGACAGAAAGGSMEVLRLLRDRGVPWDEATCVAAAGRGDVPMLTWLRERGCPWDGGTCYSAAESGSLATLRWLRERGCPIGEFTAQAAARSGSVEMLAWLREQGECPWSPHCLPMFAAFGGHLPALQWLCGGDGGCRMSEQVFSFAACGGHLEVLRWLVAKGCPWNPRDTGIHAAVSGQVEVLELLHASYPYSSSSFLHAGLTVRAAAAGRLEVLEWLRDRGCPWGEESCTQAAAGGHLAVLQWLRRNGCPWGRKTGEVVKALRDAAIVAWAIEAGCPGVVRL